MDVTSQRGFSLIELVVVTGIIVVISGLMLVSNSRFGGTVQLETLAFDIGLSIRQAQVYGVSVRQFSTGVFSAGYGMHFDTANPTSYELFGDAVVANGLYDTNELVLANAIGQGYRVQQLCATLTGGQEDCTKTKLDIMFKRPEPDAFIAANGVPCISDAKICYESARITVRSPRDASTTMSITVSVNGQVSISRP